MNAVLSPFDRATLIAWRATNLVGWCALGAFVSWNLHWIVVQFGSAGQIAGYHLAGQFEPDLGVGATAKLLACRLALALLIAVVLRTLVARRVWVRPALCATIAAAVYVVLILITLEHSRSTGGSVVFGLGMHERDWAVANPLVRMVLHDLVIASAIPLSWFAARNEMRRRPTV